MQREVLAKQAHLTPHAIKQRLRQQFETDVTHGTLPPCAEHALERVIASSVDTMWDASQIKISVPVSALRRARDEMRLLPVVAAQKRANGQSAYPCPIFISGACHASSTLLCSWYRASCALWIHRGLQARCEASGCFVGVA